MMNRKLLLVAAGALFGLVLAVGSASAWMDYSRTNYVTFSAPVSLPGVALGSGTYIFEVAAPQRSLDIVRVLDTERRVVYFTGFTEEVRRPADLAADRPISFGEAVAGLPLPITAWYPAGDVTGHRFLYSGKR